jgi:hypothetical protein
MSFTHDKTGAVTMPHAVFGDGLVLIPGERGGVSLYGVAGSGAQSLGIFDDVRDAWAALDALDAADGAA